MIRLITTYVMFAAIILLLCVWDTVCTQVQGLRSQKIAVEDCVPLDHSRQKSLVAITQTIEPREK